MTAIEETGTARTGKSTQTGSSQLSAGEATRSLTLPHLPYADAVHAALAAAAMPPAVLEVGVRDAQPEAKRRAPVLFMRFVWPVGSTLLTDDVRSKGLTLAWSHVTGWSAHNAADDAELLEVDPLADPRLIAMAALDLAEQDLSLLWSPPDGTAGRWSEAVYLDIALVHFDEQDGGLR
ncbi:hypothetical protein C1I97_25175 [Streptomyces sp. NTH33]|uniref:hypothetical protein n=1 Tax=Streptomyces sp. NTH33 TaxID=1735453 RepID=UPI000DAABDAF|nr:hypothetical protein [Streptomyces sp. NTH33]PZG97830.1 hypothetical protein C1I97_25175 [Streptomyces sp. NTH33]